MATLASTNVSTTISPNAEQPIGWGNSGLIMEIFRVPGGAVADTVALTPRLISNIRTVFTGGLPASSTIAATSTNTAVTLTLVASAATSVTFDVQVVGQR